MSSTRFTVRLPLSMLCAFAVAVAGCGHEAVRQVPDGRSQVPAAIPGATTNPKSRGEAAVRIATGQIGVPYRYGGNSRRGFDCSGLVQYAWARAGVDIPRTTSQQWQRMARVRSGQLRQGDLLFFRIDGRISHVGMYMGSGKFVHAPSSGRHVSVARLDDGFYRDRFVGATRP